MTRAFIFPGQGSQAIGMGKELAETYPTAKAVFDEVDEALSQKLSSLMFDGDIAELTLTENAQPALMAVSVAVSRVLAEKGHSIKDNAAFVAGHSLGEYSALCAADALTLSDTARLLRTRGQAMQKAVPVGIGGMAAIMGPSFEEVDAIAKEAAGDQLCCAANDNAEGQVVISGHIEAVRRAIEIAKEKGVKRCVELPVSAPFHSPLMQPAADVMAEALAAVTVSAPVVPVVNNVTAEASSDPETLRRLLVEQVTGAVRWRESVLYLKNNAVTELVEIGSGKVLSGLARRIDRSLTAKPVGTPADIDAYLNA